MWITFIIYTNIVVIMVKNMPIKIIIDAGHGGVDNGASFGDRREKDDVLRLALAVGKILDSQGYEVAYTRTEDVYDSPVEKARIGNASGADFFVSIHRNSSDNPNMYNGVETLVYDESGIKAEMARNINRRLEQVGYKNLGIDERPGLAVLRRTSMPAILVEAGFINSDIDNNLFDNNFDATAQAIADGINETIRASELAMGVVNSYHGYTAVAPVFADERLDVDERPDADDKYQILVGIFRSYGSASYKMNELINSGYETFIYEDDGLFQVRVGVFDTIDEALVVQKSLRDRGYDSLIVEYDD